jgi:hypothetical protein
MAKLGAVNPLTGGKMDLSLKGIGGLLLGGLVIWGVVATTQNAGRAITQKANSKFVDFQPDPIARAEKQTVDASTYMG